MFKDIGDNLKRFRLLSGKSLQDVGNILNLSATAVLKYERGEIIPNSEKLITFADIYKVTIPELIRIYDVPKMNFNNFRKKQSLTGKKLELLKDIIQNEISKYVEVLELNNIKEDIKIIKYKCNSLEEAEDAAINFRKKINLSDNIPMSDLTSVLENIGINIVYIENKGDFDGFDGLSEIVNGIPFIVVLKDGSDSYRQRFTLAHELGHLVMDIDDAEEKMCNRFAGALLMPKQAIVKELGINRNFINEFELKSIKQEYKVSYKALVFRLKELNIIGDYTFRVLNAVVSKKKDNIYCIEKTFQFERLVCRLQACDIINEKKAAEYLNITLEEYVRNYTTY